MESFFLYTTAVWSHAGAHVVSRLTLLLLIRKRFTRTLSSSCEPCVIVHRFTSFIALLGLHRLIALCCTISDFLGLLISKPVQFRKIVVTNTFPSDVLPAEAARVKR